jgi:hypothetical protein
LRSVRAPVPEPIGVVARIDVLTTPRRRRRRMRNGPRHRRSIAAFTPPRARLHLLAAAAVPLALALAACGGSSPEKRAGDAVETLRSWTATVRLAAESWLQGKTPPAYTRMTLQKAGQTLGDAVKTLGQGPVPPEVAAEGALLRAPEAAARRIAEAAARGDRTGVRRELAALEGVEARLRALEERLSAAEAKP